MRCLAIGLAVVVVLVGAVSAEGEIIHRIFATSAVYSIDTNQSFPPGPTAFGGMDAADWHVTFLAWRRGLVTDWLGEELVYRAILSSPTVDARDHVPISGAVMNRAGETVASSGVELWSGTLQAAVGYDEYGNAVPGGNRVWTGTGANGLWSGLSCGDWNLQSGFGLAGDATDQASDWMQIDALDAAGSARLYGMSPPYNTVTGEYLAWGTVPEPSALFLLATGALGLLAYGWRKRRS